MPTRGGEGSCSSTPLSAASGNGREAVVKLLLGTGRVDVYSKDMDGFTPLTGAASKGRKAVAHLLQSLDGLKMA